jgi:small-conductance mechanosensitive channel
MNDFLSWQPMAARLGDAREWLALNAQAISLQAVAQSLIVVAGYLLAWGLSVPLRRAAAAVSVKPWAQPIMLVAGRVLAPLTLPLLWLLMSWIAVAVAREFNLPSGVLNLAATLVTAWVIIRLIASAIGNAIVSRYIAAAIWVVAALNILGLIDPVMTALDSVALTLGDLRFSLLAVIKTVIWLALAVWAASLLTHIVERRVFGTAVLTPSMQVLITKLAKVCLLAVAVVVALAAVGIDLTAFAVLTGAIGVGIGFGLQKAVANFVSGLSMLLDRSIKPGDVISVDDTFGWVTTMGGRYVSVRTRDGLEYLIPNEDLISKQVINWSMSDNRVRIRVPIGISYRSDVHKARAICVEAAKAVTRVVDEPAPLCHLTAFGDSAVELELRFWITDPRNGIVNVKSEVLLEVWDRFKAAGIEIPFPQRDLHINAPVRMIVDPPR